MNWNTELISSITIASAATVPIILSIVQAVKMSGIVKDKYAPFVSIGVGIFISFLLANEFRDFGTNILSGILFGLAASGLYSGVQSTAFAIRAERMKNNECK